MICMSPQTHRSECLVISEWQYLRGIRRCILVEVEVTLLEKYGF